MGLVIAVFIITAAYIGIHAADKPAEVEGHSISTELEILNQETDTIQILKINEVRKTVI